MLTLPHISKSLVNLIALLVVIACAAPTVAAAEPTQWTMTNEHLNENGQMSLSGEFSFEDSNGSISCDASATLVLFAEAEKEAPEGELESLSGSDCEASDHYETLCGAKSIKSVSQVGTATVTADEEKIYVTGLAVLYKFDKCAIGSLQISGNPTLSINSAKFIEDLDFTKSFKVHNSNQEEINAAETVGDFHVQPHGVFHLIKRADDPDPPPGEISVDAEEFPASFTASGGSVTYSTGAISLDCDSVTGSGEINTTTAGVATLTLHGCDAPFGIKCTSPGQEAGVIQFTLPLPIYLATVTHAESEEVTPAILIATVGGEFLSFKCSAFTSFEVTGSGILGDITSPNYNESSSTIALHMAGEGGEQEFTETSEGETEWILEASLNGGESEPFAMSMDLTITMDEEREVELTEEE